MKCKKKGYQNIKKILIIFFLLSICSQNCCAALMYRRAEYKPSKGRTKRVSITNIRSFSANRV